jgi:hypothetical protein
MIALLSFLLALFTSPFKLKSRLEAENAVLRHQLAMLRRKVRGRVQFTSGDRFFLIQLYRWFPSVLKAVTIIQPATLVRWHRAESCQALAEVCALLRSEADHSRIFFAIRFLPVSDP